MSEIFQRYSNHGGAPNTFDALYEVVRIADVCQGREIYRVEAKRNYDTKQVFPYSWSVLVRRQSGQEYQWCEMDGHPGGACRTEDEALETAFQFILRHHREHPELNPRL